jgi:Tannase and feruloyl esterase
MRGTAFRLFMIPGMLHCRCGHDTDHFDGMTALVDRVENGVAPDSIPAAQVEASEFSERGFSVRTRRWQPVPGRAA